MTPQLLPEIHKAHELQSNFFVSKLPGPRKGSFKSALISEVKHVLKEIGSERCPSSLGLDEISSHLKFAESKLICNFVNVIAVLVYLRYCCVGECLVPYEKCPVQCQ